MGSTVVRIESGLLTGIGADVAADTAPIIGLLRKNSKFARIVFGIQRELPGQIVVEANFIRATVTISGQPNLNFVPRQFLGDNPTTDAAANTFLSATIPNPFRNLVPGGSAFNTATTITRAVVASVSAVHESVGSGIQRHESLPLVAVADRQTLCD